jgi:AraC-like DNA-binding protein
MSIKQRGTKKKATDKDVNAGIVRIGPIIEVPSLLREYGCNPEPVLKSAGLPLDIWEQPETEIPFVAASRVLEASVTATGCDYFGLQLGIRLELSFLGVSGLMLRYAPDARAAIQVLIHHLNLHDTGGLVTFEITDQTARLGYLVRQPGTRGIEQIYDLSIVVACKIMRALCGAHWSPTKVVLSRNRPQDEKPYTHYFQAPIAFNDKTNYLEFPLSWLNYPNPNADPHLFSYLSERATEQQASQDTSLISNLHRMMLNAIFQRHCSAGHIAGQLGMHERTLNRKLAKLDTSFRKELEKLRYELSRQMLGNKEISINDIAAFLDYSDQAAFSRAFKKWAGVSPSEYRSTIHK